MQKQRICIEHIRVMTDAAVFGPWAGGSSAIAFQSAGAGSRSLAHVLRAARRRCQGERRSTGKIDLCRFVRVELLAPASGTKGALHPKWHRYRTARVSPDVLASDSTPDRPCRCLRSLAATSWTITDMRKYLLRKRNQGTGWVRLT